MRLSSRWLSPMLLSAAAVGLVAATNPVIVPLAAVTLGLICGASFRSPQAGLAAVVICFSCATAGSARIDARGPGGLAAYDGAQIVAEGHLDGRPRPGSHAAAALATLREPAGGKVWLQIPDDRSQPWMVSGAAFRATARIKSTASKQGEFFRSLERRGVHFVAQVQEVEKAAMGQASPLQTLRNRAAVASAAGLSGDTAALAKGITLGDDSAMSEATADAFKRSGLSHLTAVSGANVLLLVFLIYWVSSLAGLAVTPRFWVTVAVVIAYAVLCGGTASVVRATAMGLCALVAGFAGRASSRSHALAFAAVVLLLIDPWAYLDPGAQLSFAAVIGIFLLAARVRDRLPHLPPPFGEALAVTLAATASTAPIIAWHFDEVSLTAIPANVLAVLAVAPATWMGFIAAGIGQVWAGGAVIVNAVSQYPLGFVLDLAHVFAAPSWAALDCSALTATALILGPASAFAYLPRRWLGRRAIPLGVALALLTLGLVALKNADDRLPHHSITALDVGQGDAILLRGEPGCDVLVDAGPPDGGVLKKLRAAGVKQLSALVVTHAARDHHGGAAEVATSMPIDRLIDGGGSSTDESLSAARTAVAKRGVKSEPLVEGVHVECPGVRMDAIWPSRSAAEMALSDPNLSAGVFLATVGTSSALLTSDAESEILTRLDIPPVDVLKVSHHGSADPRLPELLERITPGVAVISSGPNSYGHPHPQTISDLRAVTSVRETGREGDVVIPSSPGGT